jgi:hypothetical protein
LESSGFGGDQGVFVGLGGGQGAGRIQLHQIIIIEHTFNIRLAADTFAANRHRATDGQHLTNPDNTCRISDVRGCLGYLSGEVWK